MFTYKNHVQYDKLLNMIKKQSNELIAIILSSNRDGVVAEWLTR